MHLLISAIFLFKPVDLIAFPDFHIPTQSAPWSEITGPSARYEVWLMSPTVALVTQSETWQTGDMTLRLNSPPDHAIKEGRRRLACGDRLRRGPSDIFSSMSDPRYALRSLSRSPVFTVVAILSLALGAGANTAIFSLIDSVLLKMLPIDRPSEVFFVSTKPVEAGGIRISINISNAAVKRMQQSAPETAIAHS